MIRLEKHVSPEHLAVCGILVLPAFLFGGSLSAKLILTALYLLLFLLTGGRVRVLPNLIVAFGIIAANLLTPFGRIYLRVGNFPVTEGALRLGAVKAATIIGLIYLSRLTIRSTIRLPGRVGEVLSLTLYYFERITARRIHLDRRNLWAGLDETLRQVYETASPETSSPIPLTRTRGPGFLLCAAFVLTNWHVFLFFLQP